MTDSDLHPDEPSEKNWAPTRASTAIALLATAGGVFALSSAVGVGKGAAVAVAGAVCLAAALWFLTWERWRVPATLSASLLLVPAGAGVAAGVGYELLVTFAAAFPAPTPTRVVGQTLRIVGVKAVLVGCTLAGFGAAASVRGVVSRRTVARCFGIVNRVALLPLVLVFALAAHALVTNFGLAGTVGKLVGGVVSSVTDWLFAPIPGRLHLVGFWLLFAAATYATSRAFQSLPIRELAGDAEVGGYRLGDAVAALERGFGHLAAIGLLGLPVAVLVGVVLPTKEVFGAVPPAVTDALVTLTASAGLRHLLASVAVVAGGLAITAATVRKSSRASAQDVMVAYAPYLAGMAVVAGVGVVHRPVLRALVEFVAGRLDAPLAGRFRDLSGAVVEFYGPETIVLGLTAGVLVLAAGAIFALWLAFALGFVSDRVAGPSLAGGGLFVAAAFAGTLGASLSVVLAGLVVALVVWDAGEFAATLGSEVGRRAETRRVELLHALGSLSVGVLGVAAATGLARVVSAGSRSGGVSGGELGSLSVALLGAVAGVVLLVMALR